MNEDLSSPMRREAVSLPFGSWRYICAPVSSAHELTSAFNALIIRHRVWLGSAVLTNPRPPPEQQALLLKA
jgi:hypothetical protein